jgi:hypothetical protein
MYSYPELTATYENALAWLCMYCSDLEIKPHFEKMSEPCHMVMAIFNVNREDFERDLVYYRRDMLQKIGSDKNLAP